MGPHLNHIGVDGPTPPIVFLHGVTDSSDSYRTPMALLGGEFQMFAVDLRGHGRSGHASTYRIRDHADDLREFLTTVVRRPAVLAGHSLGALVAGLTAVVASGLVHGVLLEDPPFYTAQMPALKDTADHQGFLGLRELLRQRRTVDELAELVGAWPIHPMLFEGRSLLDVAGPEVVIARARSLHRMDPAVLESLLDGSQFDGFDVDATLAGITCPVRLLAGDVACGGVIAQADVERLATVIPRYAHRTLPGVGHFIHHTAPAEYADEVRTFVASLR